MDKKEIIRCPNCDWWEYMPETGLPPKKCPNCGALLTETTKED